MSRFIKISIREDLEQIINIDNIVHITKGEEFRQNGFFISYTLFLKNCGPIEITENVYKQIKEKLKIY